ncbi:CTPS1 (predicted) [Pycnogonum litorale]
MPQHNPDQKGGTMRLGKKTTIFIAGDSILRKLYGNINQIEERHRHRYEVNPDYLQEFEAAGMKFCGQDIDATRMEIMELEGHPYFVGVQYHPKYISRPMKPSPPYLGLILASCKKLQSYIDCGCRLSPKPEASFDTETNEHRLFSEVSAKLEIS